MSWKRGKRINVTLNLFVVCVSMEKTNLQYIKNKFRVIEIYRVNIVFLLIFNLWAWILRSVVLNSMEVVFNPFHAIFMLFSRFEGVSKETWGFKWAERWMSVEISIRYVHILLKLGEVFSHSLENYVEKGNN